MGTQIGVTRDLPVSHNRQRATAQCASGACDGMDSSWHWHHCANGETASARLDASRERRNHQAAARR
jgi:hypothetical protein